VNKDQTSNVKFNFETKAQTTKTITPSSTQTQPTSTHANMVYVEGGSFQMGSIESEREQPIHQVYVSSFYMSRFELTIGEFRQFVSATNYKTLGELEGSYGVKNGMINEHQGLFWDNPGFSQTEKHPVTCISWYDAIAYCNWRSSLDNLTPCYNIDKENKDPNNLHGEGQDNANWTVTWNTEANGYRLPSEAEWEYAARNRGLLYKFAWGNSSSPEINGISYANVPDEKFNEWLPNQRFYNGYNDGYLFTAPVGSFKANELGIFDLSGNVDEWCWDWFKDDYYTNSPINNPRGSDSGYWRVHRGGCWADLSAGESCFCRVSYRDCQIPWHSSMTMGFRLVRSVL
jgi:formylglycine-generating enzyme required for sulfatase activity